MKRIVLPLAFAFAACLANSGALAAPVSPVALTSITRLGVSTTTFSCGLNLGMCNYLILTAVCQEKMLDGGIKERTCHYVAPVPPFRLLPGERKTVGGLPADYL